MDHPSDDPDDAPPRRGRPPKNKTRALCTFMADVREAAEFTERFRTELLEEYPQGLDSEFMFRTAQAVFEADVARRGDLKNHILLRKLRQADRAQDESHRQRERAIEQRERQLELAREKFEFDAAAAVLDHLGEVREIAADHSMRHASKIQAVRRRLFGEAPPPAPVAVFPKPGQGRLVPRRPGLPRGGTLLLTRASGTTQGGRPREPRDGALISLIAPVPSLPGTIVPSRGRRGRPPYHLPATPPKKLHVHA